MYTYAVTKTREFYDTFQTNATGTAYWKLLTFMPPYENIQVTWFVVNDNCSFFLEHAVPYQEEAATADVRCQSVVLAVLSLH